MVDGMENQVENQLQNGMEAGCVYRSCTDITPTTENRMDNRMKAPVYKVLTMAITIKASKTKKMFHAVFNWTRNP